ncbi:MAG TPA: sigma-70 family RNA polymerase sigma factor [Candidatus Cybelea sp.]|nr:sigma-70 family RNA polymerase sigma factor [Candidatus Cybelea sp.]
MELTDDGLLRHMAAGDEEAFTLLYRRKQPAIYRFALHMTGNAEVAEDVTQEVFMSLIRDPRRFDPAKGTLGGFLFGIARNHIRKRWEQDRRIVGLPEGIGDIDELAASLGRFSAMGNGFDRANGNGRAASARPVDHLDSIEAVRRVRQVISTLPENYREVVVLCELEEMSYEEAATTLECPVGTVRSRLHRARALLVEKLSDLHSEPRALNAAVGAPDTSGKRT